MCCVFFLFFFKSRYLELEGTGTDHDAIANLQSSHQFRKFNYFLDENWMWNLILTIAVIYLGIHDDDAKELRGLLSVYMCESVCYCLRIYTIIVFSILKKIIYYKYPIILLARKIF